MGQDEVLKWLEEQRRQGVDNFFTVKEIQTGLLANGCNGSSRVDKINRAVTMLLVYGYLEDKPANKKTILRRVVRFKK